MDARIISTRHRRAMERELPPGANPWEHYDFLIASIDYVKKDPTRHYVYEQYWDIILIDEAHNCAKPHQTHKDHRVDMQRYQFTEEISKRCTHLLLLTATPHNGYSDSYASLFTFLNVGLVHGPQHDPRITKEKARDYVCQRRRQDVLDWIRSSRGEEIPFPERDQEESFIPLSHPQKEAIKKVEAFTEYLSTIAQKETKHRRLMAAWTVMHFHKRAISSPWSLICSLQNRIKKIEEILREKSEEEPTLTYSEAKAATLDEDTGERLTDEEAAKYLDKEIYGTYATQIKELDLLKDALKAAQKIEPKRDEKLQRLKGILSERLKINPKLIIFTRYVDTLNYLETHISRDESFTDTETLTIYGEMGEGQRNETFIKFMKAKKAVLIATDCISEGIDLQYMSSQLIQYELPWNPNRLEQRNGRIDRYGQKEKTVYIRILVTEDPLDAAILKVLVEKAEQIRRDYGFSPPFFGDDMTVIDLIREADLDISFRTQTSLLDFMGEKEKSETPEMSPLNLVEETAKKVNPFSNEFIERIRNESFYGQTKLDLKDIQERLRKTRDIYGSKEEIERFIISGMRRFGTEINEHDGLYTFTITDNNLKDVGVDEEMTDICFDPVRAAKNPGLTLIDLGHPLVRQLIDHIKVTAFNEEERYGRTAYMTTKAAEEVTAVYHVLVRYFVETTPSSILEEIVPVGVTVYSGHILTQEAVNQLLHADPENVNQSKAAVKETLARSLDNNLEEIFDHTVEKRRQALCMERKTIKVQFEKEGVADWVRGIDKISIASRDLLTVTLYYPVPGGV
jgi:superfamily II DNA or RNA helicase